MIFIADFFMVILKIIIQLVLAVVCMGWAFLAGSLSFSMQDFVLGLLAALPSLLGFFLRSVNRKMSSVPKHQVRRFIFTPLMCCGVVFLLLAMFLLEAMMCRFL